MRNCAGFLRINKNLLKKTTLVLLLLWFGGLALLFTWPLVTHMTHSVAGQIGDNIYVVWMVGWLKKALFVEHVNPLNVWFLNYPEGWNMASTEIAPAQLLLALPFSLIGGETFGYNMAMLLSFVLSGMMMAGWITHLSDSRLAGWVSGTVYACLPYWQMHFLAGHLNLCGMQWIPLFFWGWFDLLNPKDGRPPRSAAVRAALGIGLTALCSQYYFFMLVLIAGVQFILILLFSQRQRLRDKMFWFSIGRFLLYALPLLILAELPFLLLAGSGGMPDRGWSSARMYSASLTDFLLPATNHFLFRNWVGQHFNRNLWIEATLYIGWIALFLALVGFVRRKRGERWLWQLIAIGVLTAILLAMGTDLHWNAQPVELTLPEALQGWTGREQVPILLPGYFLFRYLPFFAKLRALMRFGLFALILIAAAAGFGVQRIREKLSAKMAMAMSGLLVLLLVLDFLPAPQQNFAEIAPRPAELWLASQPDKGSVMRIPFDLNDDQAGTYYTLYHAKPFIGGFFNAFPPAQYRDIRELMESFPALESVERAKELEVGYVMLETAELIHEGRQDLAVLQAALTKHGLERIYQDEEVSIYAFR